MCIRDRLGLGGFLLFYFSAASMIKILEFATILSFLTSPVIAFLNLRAIKSEAVPYDLQPKAGLTILAYTGLVVIVVFTVFYLYRLL